MVGARLERPWPEQARRLDPKSHRGAPRTNSPLHQDENATNSRRLAAGLTACRARWSAGGTPMRTAIRRVLRSIVVNG